MPIVIEQIREILQPISEKHNTFIVEIVLRGERMSTVVEAYIDSDTGISLDQCADISRELSEILDAKDLIQGRYRLEVSSPGLERPLKLMRQYARNIGRICRIKYVSDGKKLIHEGTLEHISDNSVTISKNGKQFDIPFSGITETYIIPQIK